MYVNETHQQVTMVARKGNETSFAILLVEHKIFLFT